MRRVIWSSDFGIGKIKQEVLKTVKVKSQKFIFTADLLRSFTFLWQITMLICLVTYNIWLGAVTHACNLNTLGGQGRQIT